MKEEIKELCKRVLASNLSDDDKVEIITRLNKENSLTVPTWIGGGTIKSDPVYEQRRLGGTGDPCPPLPQVYCKER